ncbi:Na+-transporting NADH:ubiquinone oxidoreductase subunit NqrB [Lederbergia galactosidilyticus]|nr:Na+-transporting NADH:ubiquinone oxidoreductase subunit NqrB [Lederbergia galactosidilytica]
MKKKIVVGALALGLIFSATSLVSADTDQVAMNKAEFVS